MWNRAELKSDAKKLLFGNYWKVVLVTLILTFITGGISLNFTKKFAGADKTYDQWSDEQILDIGSQVVNDDVDAIIDMAKRMWANINPTALYIIASVGMIVTLVALLIKIFIIEPLQVGCLRWYILNRTQKPELSELLNAFRKGYFNTVKILFCKRLFTTLWTLLFIVPGIVKSFEYRMIPYLLAENPEISMSEAFEISRQLMDGNKFDTFVLDLSFILWNIAGLFFMGLVGILFVSPYIQLTNTELYVKLCMRQGEYRQ